MDFKTWLVTQKGLNESTATSRVSNIKRIEKYYGNIQTLIQKGLVNNLLDELSYTKEDERNNLPPSHKIPINGTKKDSIFNGSATLKQALELFIKFYETVDTSKSAQQTIDNSHSTLNLKIVFEDLKKLISDFKPLNIKNSYSDNRNEVRDLIQLPLLWKLKTDMPSIEWKMEYQMNPKVKDSCDIYGQINDNTAVIIEIDTYRSDQICKKYISRQALGKDMNIIYIVVTYPNNNSKSLAYKNEFDKYKTYLDNLTTLIEIGSGLKKYLYFHDL
ncbi:MAG: hypothetical protein K2M40_01605 [Muribaculaceae bacterium]|nr:hypothetical protein [Muribaculaceae bacterium]